MPASTFQKGDRVVLKESYENVEGFLDEVEGQIFSITEKKKTQGLVGAAELIKDSMNRLFRSRRQASRPRRASQAVTRWTSRRQFLPLRSKR